MVSSLDCWIVEVQKDLEPLEDRLFWVKTPFNRTCFSLFICWLSWRRRKGEVENSTSMSDFQNAQWNSWKGESDTVVYTYTVPRVTASGPATAPGRWPSLFSIVNVTVAPARGGQPATSCVRGRKQADDPRDDSYDDAAAAQTRPSPSQVSGVSKIPIKLLWRQKRVLFAYF